MPYARLHQAARNAREAAARQRRDEWQRTAWLAWVDYTYRPLPPKVRRHLTFQQWLKRFGLADVDEAAVPENKPMSKAEKAATVARANDNANAALEAFKRGVVRRRN